MAIKGKLYTQIVPFRKNGQLDLATYPGTMDIAFRNTGGSVVSITQNGGTAEVLQPGDPLLAWNGFEEYVRVDNLQVKFAGGTGELKVYLTINRDLKNCNY